MIEGGGSAKGWRRCKEFLLFYPNESLVLLQQIAAAAAKYLIKQVDAGAQVLQVNNALPSLSPLCLLVSSSLLLSLLSLRRGIRAIDCPSLWVQEAPFVDVGIRHQRGCLLS